MQVVEGYLSQTEKKAIKAILAANLMEGKVGRKCYFLQKQAGNFVVRIVEKGRGIMPVPGSPLRVMSRSVSFTS